MKKKLICTNSIGISFHTNTWWLNLAVRTSVLLKPPECVSKPGRQNTARTAGGLITVTNLEEGHGGAVLYHSILYLCLLCQVVSRVDGRLHPLHGEEGRQVCRIGGDDDECKKPPDSSYYSGGEGFRHELRS